MKQEPHSLSAVPAASSLHERRQEPEVDETVGPILSWTQKIRNPDAEVTLACKRLRDLIVLL
jgi:hypothetical protein